MTFDPDIHHRRSIRLKNYDYSQPGVYFITVCTHNREALFGHIHENAMILNEAGGMIDRWWQELTKKYPMIDTDAYTVMPNHFHGIVAIVGAALRGRPDGSNPNNGGQPHRVAPTLGDIIDWFKTMTTNDYIRGVKQCQWRPFPGKLWQRNYYEHIIRDERDLNAIREYVINNPAGWDKDNENPERKHQADADR
jgi:REP element-mobilizing transposase RayT